jgi:hypothetical protein
MKMSFDPKKIEEHLDVTKPEDIMNFYKERDQIKATLEEAVITKNTSAVLTVVGNYKKMIETYANKDSTRDVAQSEIPHLNYFTQIADAMYSIDTAGLILQEGSLKKSLKNLDNLYSKIK